MSEPNMKTTLLRLAQEEFRTVAMVLDGPSTIEGITEIKYEKIAHDVVGLTIEVDFPKTKSEIYVRVADISCIQVTR